MKNIIGIFIFLGSVFLSGSVSAQASVDVFVTIDPVAEFVEQVGGDFVKVTTLIPPGANPHSFEPSPGIMRRIAEADVYFKLGSGLEFELDWIPRLAELNPDMQLIGLSENIELMEHEEDHHHGHGDEAEEYADDPHIWTSPLNVIKMVAVIKDVLAEIDPENALDYEENAKRFSSELMSLHNDLLSIFEKSDVHSFMVFHPSWGYFAKEYDLEQISIEKEGKSVTPRYLTRVISLAKNEGIKHIFVSPQFSSRSAEVVANEIDANIVRVDPLARDYIKNLRKVADKFSAK